MKHKPVSCIKLIISSGLHELDQIFGGGLAIGSLVCIKEDKYSQ